LITGEEEIGCLKLEPTFIWCPIFWICIRTTWKRRSIWQQEVAILVARPAYRNEDG